MGNIVTNPKAFYITKKPQYEYIMKKGFSAAFANADATPKYKGVPFALTDAREQLGRYGDCAIPVTLDGTYEVQRMQNGIDYVFVPLDSADKIHIECSGKPVRISESKNRTVDLRDPDDYIPFDEYDAFERAYRMRLQAKADELQRYVDDTLGEKSPIAVRYKEPMRLGVVQPHILVNNNGQFYYFTDCDKAENKVKEFVDMEKNKEIVKISESQLRSMIAESVKGILNEIGDTPAGQWMLGRLAGRQHNRELGIDRKSEWSRSSGKIKNTTTDAEKYASDNGYGGSPDSFTAFWKGHNSENYDWYDDTDQYGEYDSRQHAYNEREAGENSAYGDAMASMIRYHKDKALKESVLRKIIAESVKKVLKEWEYNRNEGWFLYTEINNDGAEVLRISDNRGDFDYWRKNGGKVYGQYPSYEEAAKAMRYFASNGFRRINGDFVKM